MKWLILGGLGIGAYFIIRSRASAAYPSAVPAPPVPGDVVAPLPVTVQTPEGEQWEAVMEGTYILTR